MRLRLLPTDLILVAVLMSIGMHILFILNLRHDIQDGSGEGRTESIGYKYSFAPPPVCQNVQEIHRSHESFSSLYATAKTWNPWNQQELKSNLYQVQEVVLFQSSKRLPWKSKTQWTSCPCIAFNVYIVFDSSAIELPFDP